MTEIRWEDPPPPQPSQRATGRWAMLLTPLMDQPKRWAIVATTATYQTARNKAMNLRNRSIRSVPPGRWEFASRTVHGEHRVYARYLGPDEDGAP